MVAALAAFAAASINAQTSGGTMAMSKPAISVPAEFTDGEVRKIDKPNGTVVLKHGEIKNLGMPPMAMMFHVKDPAMLNKLKEGDKVRFKAVYESGKDVLVEVQPRN